MKSSEPAFSSLLKSVQAADQDFEWYPTTQAMITAVSRWLDKTAASILDIGAGDGRVLQQLAAKFDHHNQLKLYSIEKSTVLIQAQPETIIPVGTDLFEQNLACLPVSYIFCNPPYSEYETWACMIIESGYAQKSFLVLPRRWKDNEAISTAITKRGATSRVIHSDDFHGAPRKARAVIDIVEISYPMKDRYYREVKDPFDIWFDDNISTFDAEESSTDYQSEYDRDQQELARIRHLNTIVDMVAAYCEEYSRMEENYRAIFRLDYALLKELSVSKDNIRDGIKKKMSGLKAKYWTLLFERLTAITDRLSTATKATFTDKLLGQAILAFTVTNAYAVVLWSIKNANLYFDQQTITLYRDLSTFDGVLNYKSNVRTWQRNDWRYSRRYSDDDPDTYPSRYMLDYRIVVERHGGIGGYGFSSWDYPGHLYKGCHEMIADVVAVLYNLGFPSTGARSLDREWHSGEWQDWHTKGEAPVVLFQVKAHKNGNLHFRFLPAAIKALNVEAGRLLGWLHSPSDVVKELGYTEQEAEQYFSCTNLIVPGAARLLLGTGEGTSADTDESSTIDQPNHTLVDNSISIGPRTYAFERPQSAALVSAKLSEPYYGHMFITTDGELDIAQLFAHGLPLPKE